MLQGSLLLPRLLSFFNSVGWSVFAGRQSMLINKEEKAQAGQKQRNAGMVTRPEATRGTTWLAVDNLKSRRGG